MEQLLKALIGILKSLLGRLSGDCTENIIFTDGFYRRDTGFRLYVGVAGDVHFRDCRGYDQTRFLIAGYHPMKVTEVSEAGTTATELGACFD
jgi:hypothetical protein